MNLNQLSLYITHQPLLILVMEASKDMGDVLELGCGLGSTVLLHGLCDLQGRCLCSLDIEDTWLRIFRRYKTPWHTFRKVNNWRNLPEYKQDWGLVFVDQSPITDRGPTIKMLRERTKVFVLHDVNHLWNCRSIFIRESFKYIYMDKSKRTHTAAFSDEEAFDKFMMRSKAITNYVRTCNS